MDTVDDVIAHYGVIGMKWGKQKSQESSGSSGVSAKQEHKEWKKNALGPEQANKVFQEAARTFGPAQKAINNDPAFKGKDLNVDRKAARQYDEVMTTVFNQHMVQASEKLNTNKAGDRTVVFQFDRNTQLMRGMEYKRITHADEKLPVFKATLNALGQVISFTLIVDDTLAQSDVENVDDVIAHYGVPGMKWGKRKADSGPPPKATAVKVTQQVGKKKLKATGGQYRKADPDAVKAAVAKQKAKASGVATLSNAELKVAVERMNLERQYRSLKADEANAGKKFAVQLITGVGKQQATGYANSQVSEILKKSK